MWGKKTKNVSIVGDLSKSLSVFLNVKNSHPYCAPHFKAVIASEVGADDFKGCKQTPSPLFPFDKPYILTEP